MNWLFGQPPVWAPNGLAELALHDRRFREYTYRHCHLDFFPGLVPPHPAVNTSQARNLDCSRDGRLQCIFQSGPRRTQSGISACVVVNVRRRFFLPWIRATVCKSSLRLENSYSPAQKPFAVIGRTTVWRESCGSGRLHRRKPQEVPNNKEEGKNKHGKENLRR